MELLLSYKPKIDKMDKVRNGDNDYELTNNEL